MGVNGEKPVTLTAGQTFYEGPKRYSHSWSRREQDDPAKFSVILLKDKVRLF